MLTLYTTQPGAAQPQQVTRLPFLPDAAGEENRLINLYPNIHYEALEGFGGAITDAAAFVYSQMSPAQRRELLEHYFTPQGMNYQFVRIPMDSCDFSVSMYEAKSSPSQVFDFSRTEQYILPMLRDAEAVAGRQLPVFLSPWSPPAYMKTNLSRIGGSLKKEYYEEYAHYLCTYIENFQRHGFRVARISLQNEPKATQTWDSCVFSAQEEKEFLQRHMYPALQKHGLGHVEIFVWDHNKERAFERAVSLIDSDTAGMVSGVACHWYSGDHFESLSLLRSHFPNLKLVISESCIEFSNHDRKDAYHAATRLAHEIFGDLNHGVTAFYDWNVLLDQQGGPNHVGNYCLAPFLFDTQSHELQPQLIQSYIAHFCHYLKPGAVRIGFSRFTSDLDTTAYQNPDGRIVVVMMNRSSSAMPVCLRLDERICRLELPANSISTAVVDAMIEA